LTFSENHSNTRRSLRRLTYAICIALMALAIASIASASAGEPPASEITAISPDHGPRGGGNTVVITGTNFTGATAVWFGGREAESFTVITDSQITAVAPAITGPGEGRTLVEIVVVGPGGESDRTNPAAKYGYTPVLYEIDPNYGPAAGGTAVTLFGYGLEEATEVDFGHAPAQSFTVNPDGSVTAISPPIAPGETIVPITATTPEGTTESFSRQEIEPANFFTYGPTVTGVTPSEGPAAGGTVVTIHGTGFESPEFFCLCGPFVFSVTFGVTPLKCGLPFGAATPACSPVQFEVKSETEIVATTPPGNGTVDVGVFTDGGPSPANPAIQFTYAPDPSPEPVTEGGGPEIVQLLSCAPSGHLRHQGVAKVCSSRSVDASKVGSATGPVNARLYRGKVTYAMGSARLNRRRAHLWLDPVRSIKPGRYALALSRQGGSSQRESIVIR
jgi:hypothetical protein